MESLALCSISATTSSFSLSTRSSLLRRSSKPIAKFPPSIVPSPSLPSTIHSPALLSQKCFLFAPLHKPFKTHFPIRASSDSSASSKPQPIANPSPQGAKLVPLIVSVSVGLILRFCIPKPVEITPQAWQLLAIFLSTIAGLILNPLPVGAWAFLGLTTSIVTRTLTFSAAFSAFTNEVIWLIVISFFFARGFVKTGLGDRVATYFVKMLGKSTLGLSYGLTISEALIAPAMPSTTARAGGVFLPIIKSLSLSAGSKPGDASSRKLGAFLIQSQLQSAGNSSALFLTAAAQNLLCLKLAEELGVIISSPWVSWFKAASLPALVSLLATPFILYKLYPPETKDTPDAPAMAAKKLEKLGPVTKNEWIMVGTMVLAVTMWVLGDAFGIPSVVAAMIALSILLLLGVLDWDDCLSEKSAWDTLAWFAVLVGMASQLTSLGIVTWMSGSVANILQSLSLSWHLLSLYLLFSSHHLPLSHGSTLPIMPSQPNFHFSLPRWIGLLCRRNRQIESNDSSGDSGSNNINVDDTAVSNSVECYACTQVGVPAFHSTSCDHAHQPEWVASAGSSLVPIQNRPGPKKSPSSKAQPRVHRGPLKTILDPRSKRVQKWNRAFLLARGMALAIDPLFFYALSIGRGGAPCLYMDGGLAAIVTVLRTCVDAVHLCHLWLQFRLAYVSRESLVVGCGKLVWDARAIASHYGRSLKGFWFDAFVILPVPQAVFWLVLPKLIREEHIKLIMTILLLIFLFQFLPKVYHCIYLMRKMQKVTGYIFGTIWWGFGLNLIAYFIASHVAGGCWYVLAIQRAASCLRQQCQRRPNCDLSLSCSEEICYQFLASANTIGNPCGGNFTTAVRKPMCLDIKGPFKYGIYKTALPVISSNSLAVKIFYPIFWGLMTLSTFGNDLEPTNNWLEVIFSICIVLSGLMLFTLLIGNIQVFLHAVMAKKRKMQLRCRDMEWWMRRRQLPSRLRQRVRNFERQRWAAMGGDDEMELIKDLPEGLRREIKRYLCLDLIKKVPLFHNLDDLILDNICDRVRPLVYSKDEKIIREGDPVQRMVFIIRGRIKRSQSLSKGMVATSVLEPGGFLGDELLSWCLRRPFIDRLPASSATFVCIESTEAFGLDANHLRYITDHFRYKFANERLKRTARYYSSNWRTWAAVNIQFAWRRYRKRTRGPVTPVVENGGSDRRLLQYAAMFMSIRPHDHLE